MILPAVLGILVIMLLASWTTFFFSIGINVLGMFLYFLNRGAPCSRGCCKFYAKIPEEYAPQVLSMPEDAEIS